MSYNRLLTRATYGDNSGRQRTGLIIGVVCGVIAVMLVTAIWNHRCKSEKRQFQRDPEAQRAEQRRIHGGWYRRETPPETAVERRTRIAREARASRGYESGVEREARREREARDGEPAPPMYQLPAPTYPTTLETRRQWLMANRPLTNPPIAPDAPPAYDSPAVWPVRG